MLDLTQEMTDLMGALGTPAGSNGRALMFVSAYRGEGVSTIAREYARCEAAVSTRPIWLVDADLQHQTQLADIAAQPQRFGLPGPLSQATPDGSAFFAISPPPRDRGGNPVPDARFLVARPFLRERLWVTRFRDQNLRGGQRVRLFDQTTYWTGLRRHAQTIVVDVAAFEAGRDAIALAPLMDGVILVVSEDVGQVKARQSLKADIEAAGGRCLGIFYNRAQDAGRAGRGPKVRVSA